MSEQLIPKKELDVILENRLLKLKGSCSNDRDKIKFFLEETAREYAMAHPVELFTNSRDMTYVVPRRIAVFLIRDQMNIAFTKIGDLFGYKDHTASFHAYRVVQEEVDVNESLCITCDKIVKRVKDRIKDL